MAGLEPGFFITTSTQPADLLAAHRDGAARFAYRKEHNMLATLTRLFPLWALLLSV
ncbi:TPA: bile acid:sodium symporter, partial [Klebsiella pneumoniae]|nr:bile acid:sodium symporter [Klebsiella pneumoniae]